MQIIFNVPDAQVPRLRAMMLKKLGPTNPATATDWTDQELLAEFKGLVRQFMVSEVQQYELLQEHETVFANYTHIDITEQ